MKSITMALALAGSVALAGAASAQTAPKPPVAAPAPPASPQPQPPAPTPPTPGATAQNAAPPSVPMPGGPPEGMVVETPNGFFLVRPGEAAPRKLDLGQGGQGTAQMAQQPGDEAMDDHDDEGMQPPPPPRPHHPPRRPMMDSKGARFRIRGPNLTVGVKCPDDEPVKACVDAISQLLDKVNAAGH